MAATRTVWEASCGASVSGTGPGATRPCGAASGRWSHRVRATSSTCHATSRRTGMVSPSKLVHPHRGTIGHPTPRVAFIMQAKSLDPRILPAVSAVHSAAERLRSVLAPSRIMHADALSQMLGVDVFYKCELENPTGSFKLRGAYNVLAQLSPAERAAGVVASSAGNHGLG